MTAAVDVVVGVDGGLRSEFTSGDFNGAVRDDLVHVHVGLGSGAGLENHQWEVVIKCALNDLIACLGDETGYILREFSELRVRQRRGFLQDTEGLDHGPAPYEGFTPDVEVVK